MKKKEKKNREHRRVSSNTANIPIIHARTRNELKRPWKLRKREKEMVSRRNPAFGGPYYASKWHKFPCKFGLNVAVKSRCRFENAATRKYSTSRLWLPWEQPMWRSPCLPRHLRHWSLSFRAESFRCLASLREENAWLRAH